MSEQAGSPTTKEGEATDCQIASLPKCQAANPAMTAAKACRVCGVCRVPLKQIKKRRYSPGAGLGLDAA